MRPKKKKHYVFTDHRPETAWSFYTQVLGASLFYNLLAKGTIKDLASHFGERCELWTTGEISGLPSPAN